MGNGKMLPVRRWKRVAMLVAGTWIPFTVSCEPTSVGVHFGPDGWYSGTIVLAGASDYDDCCHDDGEYTIHISFSGQHDADED